MNEVNVSWSLPARSLHTDGAALGIAGVVPTADPALANSQPEPWLLVLFAVSEASAPAAGLGSNN